MEKITWRVEKEKVSNLKNWDKNPRKITAEAFEKLKERIQKRGFHDVVKTDGHGIILSGNQRKRALVELQMEEVFIMIPSRDLTEDEKNAVALESNRNDGQWDWDMMANNFDIDFLLDIGFAESEFGFRVEEDKDQDEVPLPPKTPQTKLGDVYEIGRHRIVCGDSTDKKTLDILMSGKLADSVFTDPPYNVDYHGDGENTSNKIMNDNMSTDEFLVFLKAVFTRIKFAIKESAGCYIFHSHKTASTFDKALNDTGFHIDTQLIWNKPSAGMGMNDYRTKHEPFFYCYLDKQKKIFYGDRTGTTVWKIPNDEAKQFEWFKKQMELDEQGQSTVWSMKRANVSGYLHPTQKPVELCLRAIANSSKPRDIVLDLFLGSGTTIISCEKSGRSCYGLELDPIYVDVCIQRYVDYTQDTTVKKNGEIIDWTLSPTPLDVSPA